MGIFDFFRKRKDAIVKEQNTGMVVLIIKEKVAENLLDFLEAEFAQGIGSDPDCKGIEYVENIRSVYKALKRAVK